MNATCKRLLSWLVVVTMVLSMVPVFDLSGFAITTKAAAQDVCPGCGEEVAEWTVLSGSVSNTSGHYILTDGVTVSGYGIVLDDSVEGKTLCLDLNGNTFTAGKVAIQVTGANTVNVMDSEGNGAVIGKQQGNVGAAVTVNYADAEVNLLGGTFKRGAGAASNEYSRAVTMGAKGGTINAYEGATIDGRFEGSVNGGVYPTAVYVQGGEFNLEGGEIIGGTASSDAGSVRVDAGATFNMQSGTVRDGQGRSGGNFALSGGTLNLYGGDIENGKAASTTTALGGGNIYITAGGTLHMEGGTISGGTITGSKGVGGNIAIRDQDGYYGTVEILGGKVINGTAKTKGDNICVRGTTTNATALTIGGTAQISSGIVMGDNTTFELSGAPVIKKSGIEGQTIEAATAFAVTNGGNLDVSKITGGEIQIEGALGDVFSARYEKAAEIAQYFVPVDATLDVVANDNNQLEIVEYVEPSNDPVWGVFDPAGCGGLAYCEHCGQAAGPQTWEAISGTGLAAMTYGNNTKPVHYHYYLSGTVSFTGSAFTFSGNNNNICLNLNGQTMTTGNRAFVVTYGNTVSVMDTEGGSVTGKYTGQNATVFYLSNPNAKVNVYGGTFKRSTDSATSSSVVRIENLGGVFTMYDGKIEATAISGTNAQPGIYMAAAESRTATFNMRGGEIVGTATTSDGGAVYVTARTTFNLYDGTISGGSGRAGGNIMVYTGALNIYDGTITGGKSTNNNASVTGGNIAVRDGGSVYMEGGAVCGGEAVQNGGNIAMWYSVNSVEIVGGKIYGGVAGTNGANIYNNGTAGSVLTIGGTAEIAGDIATNQNTANTLSGTPKILTSGLYAADGTTAVTGTKGYEVKSNTNLNVTGVTGGKIQVTGDAGIVFSAACENAATVAQYFEATGAKQAVEANTEKKLVIIEDAPQVGKFEPWKYEGLAYCPVCGGSEPVEWIAIDKNFVGGTLISANNAGKHDHVYLAEDISGDVAVGGYFLDTGNNNRICLNLNGKTLNVTNGRAFMRNFCYAYWKIMDTEGGAQVSGNGVFRLDAAGNRTVDVYGGTFKTNNDNSIVEIGGNGGTFNLHGGTLDATGASVGAIGAQGKKTAGATATINVSGGQIIGNGTIAIRVGSVLQAGGTEDAKIFLGTAVFNMTGGSITNGYVQVRNDNSANISGGFIEYLTVVDGAYEEGSSDNADVDYSGTTTITMTGAPEVAQFAIGENVAVDISGMTGGELAVAGKIDTTLFADNANVTITAYAADKFVAVEDGKVCLKQNGAAVVTAEGKVFYKTAEEALAASEGGYVEIYTDNQTITVADDQVIYVDNRGYTVNVNGEGALYAMDAANDDYVGYGAFVVADGVTVVTDVINPINGNRYIVIKNTEEGTAYSAHRVELELTHISLRTSQAGLYYKAAYKCDGTLAGRVNAFGIVFSGVYGEIHQGNFDAVKDIYSIAETGFTPDENHTVNGTSVAVFGIFKNEGRTAAENITAGELKIHATPYINVDADANGVSEADNYVLGNVQNDTYKANAGVVYKAMSLYDVLKSINDNWAAYESAQEQVKKFYQKWATKGMDAWATDLANIANA